MRTDKNSAYLDVPDRWLAQVNLSRSPVPAHITFKWIHIVFANVKRWALGTFHGFREKHLDAYLNEFVFRWNRPGYFRSSMEAMLGIGRRIGPSTYRSIVGDTRQWKQDHIEEIMKMLHPNKRKIVSDLAMYYRVSRLEVMENIVWWTDRLGRGGHGRVPIFRLDFRRCAGIQRPGRTSEEKAAPSRSCAATTGRGAPNRSPLFQSECPGAENSAQISGRTPVGRTCR
ncbi:hypothetical protein AB7M37_006471 [Sinorhizobium fredii]